MANLSALKDVLRSDFLLGDHAELCYGPPGSSLGELVALKDVQDVTTLVTSPNMTHAMIVFTMVWNPANEHWRAFRNAFRAGSLLEFASLDRKRNVRGSQGIKGIFRLTGFNRIEAIGDAIRTEITATLEAPGEWIDSEDSVT